MTQELCAPAITGAYAFDVFQLVSNDPDDQRILIIGKSNNKYYVVNVKRLSPITRMLRWYSILEMENGLLIAINRNEQLKIIDQDVFDRYQERYTIARIGKLTHESSEKVSQYRTFVEEYM